ncbi:MAG: alpha/beta hydrolase [Rikenellaceae bacterium]
MEKFVMAGPTAIRYRDIGKGAKTIVLLHGYLESIEVWDDFAGELGKNFRIISFDLPGHGISEVMGETHTMEFIADTLNFLLEKLSVIKINIVGHSLGGYVALAFSKKYSSKVESLTLFHSSPNSDNEERRKGRQREIEIIKSCKKELLTSVNPGKSFAPQNRQRFEHAIDELSEQAMLTEDEGIVALLNGMTAREDMNDFLKTASFKQLFIFGKFDEFIPNDYAESIITNNPQAKIIWLENSGHMGFIEEEKISVEALSEFIGE